MATKWIGTALTEQACTKFRAVLEGVSSDQDKIESMMIEFRAQYEREHCPDCGDFLVAREDGTGTHFPCYGCNRPRRPYPKSRQGYRVR
jgi:predicted RNA-binding Zn-ribbon protein involved in translation (DUF1610 family)